MFKDPKAPDCACELKDGVDPCDPIFDGAFQFGLDGRECFPEEESSSDEGTSFPDLWEMSSASCLLSGAMAIAATLVI